MSFVPTEPPPEPPIMSTLVGDAVGAGNSPVRPQTLSPEPWNWRELLALAALVAALDLTIYRGHGYAGFALLFIAAPALLAFGARWPMAGKAGAAVIVALLVGLAVRSVWCGNYLATLCGLAGIVALAHQLTGQTAFVLETIAFGFQVVPAGLRRLFQFQRSVGNLRLAGPKVDGMSFALPLAALLAFGTLFLLANPDLVRLFSDRWAVWVERLSDWLGSFSWGEIAFCAAMAVVSLGLLRPSGLLGLGGSERVVQRATDPRPSDWYAPVRNTLLVVNVLFAAYLAFEFRTLWFREFPKGFYYSGYAHQGAAWLTVALGLATLSLSLFFRGELLADPRLRRLQQLATAWAVLNVLLAVAVYHRLWIYVGFNGMTRMRTVGFLGTTAVVGGLLLVLWKITQSRNFLWLVRRQLWVLAAMVYIYAVLPVDRWITQHNVRQILAGNLAPSVQIAEHPNSDEGFLMLAPLLECSDVRIRDGVQALLATLDRRHADSSAYPVTLAGSSRRGLLSESPAAFGPDPQVPLPWSAYQAAHQRLRGELTRLKPQLQPKLDDPAQAATAWQAFQTYAYQWY